MYVKVRIKKNNVNNRVIKSKKSFGGFIKSLFSREDKKIDFEILRTAFEDVKEEFDDHRESINYNTNEIQANYEYLAQLDSKMQKMDEKLDELMMFASDKNKSQVYSNFLQQSDFEDNGFDNIELTTREKEVFLAIYTSPTNVSYREISRKTGLSQNLVACYVRNLVSKGIPLSKNYVSDMEVAVVMDPLFKEMQAKSNIAGLNEKISKRNF